MQLTSSSELHKDPGVPKLISLKGKAGIPLFKQKVSGHTYVLVFSLLIIIQEQRQSYHGTKHVEPSSMDIVSSIATLAAAAAAAEAEEIEQSNEAPELRAARIQKRQYMRMLHKVVDQSDIVIMVLDARDPEGCRSRMVEDEVRRREADGKRLVFVLNKIGQCTFSSLTRTI